MSESQSNGTNLTREQKMELHNELFFEHFSLQKVSMERVHKSKDTYGQGEIVFDERFGDFFVIVWKGSPRHSTSYPGLLDIMSAMSEAPFSIATPPFGFKWYIPGTTRPLFRGSRYIGYERITEWPDGTKTSQFTPAEEIE